MEELVFINRTSDVQLESGGQEDAVLLGPSLDGEMYTFQTPGTLTHCN